MQFRSGRSFNAKRVRNLLRRRRVEFTLVRFLIMYTCEVNDLQESCCVRRRLATGHRLRRGRWPCRALLRIYRPSRSLRFESRRVEILQPPYKSPGIKACKGFDEMTCMG
jgi:hypothetical protein